MELKVNSNSYVGLRYITPLTPPACKIHPFTKKHLYIATTTNFQIYRYFLRENVLIRKTFS